MANYYNPINPYIPYNSGYTAPQIQPQVKAMEWVEGEVGARAYQMPSGWPVNTPIALWDSTDTVIYLKSVNAIGMPNPLQKLKYTIEEPPAAMLQSGAQAPDMSQYVTKQDLDAFRQELKNMQRTSQHNENQNGNGNRGGSR